MSPFNAWVLLKSLDTIELRVKKQCENTHKILDFLKLNKNIQKIYYPFDPNFKQYNLAKKQMVDGGTIISFELKNTKKDKKKLAFNFLNNLELIDISNNLGDTKSLITHPDTTTHHRLSEKEKISLRITKNLVRLSVGLEDVNDLVDDIKSSLIKTYK